MKGQYVLIAALILASGCRTTEDLYQTTSLTGRYSRRPDLSVATYSQNRDDGATLASSGGREEDSWRDADRPNVRPVVYQPTSDPQELPATEELQGSEMTLLDLEAMALQSSPAITQAVAQVEAAQGNWVQVGLPPNPSLGYSGQEIGNDGKSGQQGGFVAQNFITGKKLRLNREIAAWEVERAERNLGAVRLRVLTDVRIGYYDVLIAQRRRELATDLVHIGEQGVTATQALFDAREVSEADPLRARVQAETARIFFQTSTNQYVEAWRRLSAVLGMPDLAPQPLEGELKPDEFNLSWNETLQQVLGERPEMAAAIAGVESARWGIERAHAQVIPNVNVQAGVALDNSTGDTISNISVALPIPIINRNQGGIRRAEAEAFAAEKAVDRLALDLQSRLATAFQRYESARNQVDKYSQEGGILDTAKRTLDLIQAGYQAEEFGVLDLLAAQRTFSQTNLAYLGSLREVWASAMEIRGLLLRGSLMN
ncbi:MAG: TolC family protein [Pirellulaceae bacterium]